MFLFGEISVFGKFLVVCVCFNILIFISGKGKEKGIKICEDMVLMFNWRMREK